MNQHFALEVSTAPSVEPILIAEARSHLRLTATGSPESHPDDTLVTNLIKTAREQVENHTSRALVTQTIKQYLDEWPRDGVILLMRNPVQLQSPDITAITYVDTAGDTQTWTASNYRVDRKSIPARITPAYGESFPSIRGVTNTITITYGAGYDTVPESLVSAMLLMIGHLYEHREATAEKVSIQDMPMSYHDLIAPYIVWDF